MRNQEFDKSVSVASWLLQRIVDSPERLRSLMGGGRQSKLQVMAELESEAAGEGYTGHDLRRVLRTLAT